jgi:cytochrome b6-f complex iron-sulfur subunit
MADEHTCDPACPGLQRREFLGAAALTALALLETACGNGQIGPTAVDTTGTTGTTAGTTVSGNKLIVTVSAYSALATTGGAARVDGGGGTPVALVRTGAASFSAFSLRCPHEGFTVSVQSSRFYCQAHGAQFALSGSWTGGQRTSNLASLAVSYDAAAGTVSITR